MKNKQEISLMLKHNHKGDKIKSRILNQLPKNNRMRSIPCRSSKIEKIIRQV